MCKPNIKTLLLLLLSFSCVPVFAQESVQLEFSTDQNPTRKILDQAILSGHIFVVASPARVDTDAIDTVTFSLNGRYHRREKLAPYDFNGGTLTVANAFDTSTLPDGIHNIGVSILDTSRRVLARATAYFTVNNSSPIPVNVGTRVPSRLAELSCSDNQIPQFSVNHWRCADLIPGMTGPRGPSGVQGNTGPQGPRGLQGPAGRAGTPGARGATGERGPQGVTGAQGPQGVKGERGVQGDKGEQGDMGPQGLAGPKGDTGAVGAQGPVGPTGPQGPAGQDAPDRTLDICILYSAIPSLPAPDYCPDSSRDGVDLGSRFVDLGDGSVEDRSTGLVWLKNASCDELALTDNSGRATWDDATQSAAILSEGLCGLSDGSVPGDWRLPTIWEFCSAWNGVELLCPHWAADDSLVNTNFAIPSISDASGTDQWLDSDTGFTNVLSRGYWSSTQRDSGLAWGVNLISGSVNFGDKTLKNYIWPVRRYSD